MKRQLLLCCRPVLLSIALLTGCTKKEALLTQPEKDRTPKTEFYGDGLYDALGYGYNVTGEFANDPAVRNAVIDLTKFKTDNPTRLITENIRSQDFKLEYGENARKYSEMISKRVDATVGLALFKASVTTTFSSSNASDYKYIYGSYDLMIKHKRLRVNAVNTLLSNYLTNDFKTDLQNMTAAQLVNTYGTHVLIDMYTGAKLELKYQAETNNEDRSRASSVGIKAGVSLSIVGLQATVGTQQDINESRQNYSQKLMFRTRGGDPSKGLFGEFNLGSSAPPIDIRNWQQSSTIDNAVLIDIAPQGLLPLYELITNPAKRSEVEAYIKKYLIDNQVNLTYEPVPIHCYYNARTNKHTYELDRGLDNDPFNWFYKGVYFYAYKYEAPGTVPVYHYYAPSTQDNQYSLSTDNDYNYWTMRGIKFYAYNAPSPTQKPVWQYYTSNAHFLSISPDSGGPGWGKYIAFYFPG